LEKLAGGDCRGLADEWEARLRRSHKEQLDQMLPTLRAIEGKSTQQLLGTFAAPGFITLTFTADDNVPTRPALTSIPWLPKCYGDTRPIVASMGNGIFEGCFEWIPWNSKDVMYGLSFTVVSQTQGGRDELWIYGLCDLVADLKIEHHPVVFYHEPQIRQEKLGWRDKVKKRVKSSR